MPPRLTRVKTVFAFRKQLFLARALHVPNWNQPMSVFGTKRKFFIDFPVSLIPLRDYCQRRGWQVTREYVDRGISGSKEHRPQLDQLLAACRKRLVDAVVVYRYDRFARSLRQLVNALEEFRSLGIDFISLHEGVDTSTP